MEENKDAIARVRAYGELLKTGAPHQMALGADIVLVADLAAFLTTPAAPAPDVTGLRDEITLFKGITQDLEAKLADITTKYDKLEEEYGKAVLDNARRADGAAKYDELSKTYDELVRDHDRLTTEKVALETANKKLAESVVGTTLAKTSDAPSMGGAGTSEPDHAHLTKAQKKARREAAEQKLDLDGKDKPAS